MHFLIQDSRILILTLKSLVNSGFIAIFVFIFFFSGPKTGPNPTPPKPKTTTSSPVVPTKPTPSEKTTTVSTTTHVDPSQDACQINEFDAITEIQKELHFFKDRYKLLLILTWNCKHITQETSKFSKKFFEHLRHYWKISSKGERKGPFLISEKWPGLPATINSAFEEPLTKKMYFFAGTYLSDWDILPSLQNMLKFRYITVFPAHR